MIPVDFFDENFGFDLFLFVGCPVPGCEHIRQRCPPTLYIISPYSLQKTVSPHTVCKNFQSAKVFSLKIFSSPQKFPVWNFFSSLRNFPVWKNFPVCKKISVRKFLNWKFFHRLFERLANWGLSLNPSVPYIWDVPRGLKGAFNWAPTLSRETPGPRTAVRLIAVEFLGWVLSAISISVSCQIKTESNILYSQFSNFFFNQTSSCCFVLTVNWKSVGIISEFVLI